MASEIRVNGLSASTKNLILKPLKKSHYKEFDAFCQACDGAGISLEEYCQLYASKEFLFLQCGKLWLYLFEKQTSNKFEVGEIVGYIELTPESEFAVEVGYFVKESKRGRGYAKTMLKMAVEICTSMEYKAVIAKVANDNFVSVAVLNSCGFNVLNGDNEKNVWIMSI